MSDPPPPTSSHCLYTSQVSTVPFSVSSASPVPSSTVPNTPSFSYVFECLFSSSKPPTSRRDLSRILSAVRNPIPRSLSPSYTPTQLAYLWLSDQLSQSTILDLDLLGSVFTAKKYKKVENKTRPVATTLPEKFRIVRRDHPNPLVGLQPMPRRPPEFTPTGRITRERRAQMTIGDGFLLPEEVKLAEWIVCQHESAFAHSDDERGAFDPKYFDPIEVPIISHTPWVHRQGPIPRGILEEVTRIIKDKWQSGVYEPSSSSYNSRWFCVLKKDKKSLRLVHSLEPLNAVTVKNAAAPPYTDVVAEDFAGRSIYSVLDLYVAFDQRELHEQSRDMTTFTTPLGPFRLTVLPMGWTNSPAVLQGDITHILKPEIPHWTKPFADDVPIAGPATRYERSDGSYETVPGNPGIRRFVWEHLEVVHRIIQRVKAYGATFAGKKSFIGVPEAEIVGHLCTYEGRIADPKRIKVIQDWPVPTNLTEVRAFLGTCGVLRIFIKNYTLVARPLIQLTRKGVPFEFGPSQLDAFEELKYLVANSPALRPLDYKCDRPVILAVDSCMNGTGYLLLQVGEDGKRYPSRFGSITFNDRESRYSQAKLELYGLLRALRSTQLFTIGVKKFIVEMDAKFIKGMLNNPTLHPNDAVNRWIAAILLFDFDLVHVPAEKHTGADGLSRRPRASEDPPSEESTDLDDWIDTSAGLYLELSSPPLPGDPSPPLALLFDVPIPERPRTEWFPESTASAYNVESLPPSDPSPEFAIPRSDKAIKQEKRLAVVRSFLETMERPPGLSDAEYRKFLRKASGYFLQGSKMFRRRLDGDPQLIPLPHERLRLITYAHDHLGHKGNFATTKNLLVRFWWPHLQEDVQWYIRSCHECQVRQTEYFFIPPVVAPVPTLFRVAYMDTFFMPRFGGSYRYVHHARCGMSSYPEGRASTADTHEVIMEFIFRDILCRWGGLAEIITDNAPPYIAAVNLLGERYGIHHIRISGYNSQANGVIESTHFNVREAIMKTCQGNERKWRSVLPQVLWAERVTIRKATGYSPYYIAHGVHPLLPFDITEAAYLSPTQDFGMTTTDLIALRAQQLSKRPEDLKQMQTKVTEYRRKALQRFEKDHEGRIIDFNFQPGALVLVRNTREEDTLSRKTKPRYLGPMVVVRKTRGTSYVIAELDGSQSNLRVAGFRLIPYFPRARSSVPIIPDTPDELDRSRDDSADVNFFNGLTPEERVYTHEEIPSL